MTGIVIWITGLPGSGKSSIARHLVLRLLDRGREPLILDGDEVRAALVPTPGYDDAGRDDFYRSLGRLALLAARQGLIAIVAATAHRRRWRDEIRAKAPGFLEVYVATPLAECRARDPKHLYAGETAALPGVGAAYEPPRAPEVIAPHGDDAGALAAILTRIDRHSG